MTPRLGLESRIPLSQNSSWFDILKGKRKAAEGVFYKYSSVLVIWRWPAELSEWQPSWDKSCDLKVIVGLGLWVSIPDTHLREQWIFMGDTCRSSERTRLHCWSCDQVNWGWEIKPAFPQSCPVLFSSVWYKYLHCECKNFHTFKLVDMLLELLIIAWLVEVNSRVQEYALKFQNYWSST